MLDIATQSYWRDEAFSVLLASRQLPELFSLIVRFDHTPPLFYYLQHGWVGLFGSGEIPVRILSLIFHLLAVYFVYKISRSRLIALVVAFNPYLWGYALEARHYSAYGAFVLGGIYFYKAKKHAWSNLFWVAALLTHNFAWLYFGAFWLVFKAKKLWPAIIIGGLWLPFAWEQITGLNEGMWLKPPAGWLWWWDSWQAFWVTPALSVMALALLLKPTKLIAVALTPPVIAFLVSLFWQPVYLERYLLPTLPLIIIAGMPGLKRWGWILALATILGFWQVNQQASKVAMRPAVAQIVSQIQPNELVVTEQPINYLEVYYYLQQSGNQNKLYSRLYPGEDRIPYYVGTALIKPWQEIVAIPEGRPYWLIQPDGSVVKYE